MTKVLVIEDDRYLGAAYSAKLTKAGFDFRIAVDGAEAMGVLAGFMPDIILLDVVMPRKDGFTVLAELKKDDQYKQIPVMIVSNLEQLGDRNHALELGAIDFITKSQLTLDEIVERVNKVLAGDLKSKAA
jgi:DNA-binding response OmpR family regulator